MIDQEKLIPEIQNWRLKNGQEFDLENWTAIEGNIKLSVRAGSCPEEISDTKNDAGRPRANNSINTIFAK